MKFNIGEEIPSIGIVSGIQINKRGTLYQVKNQTYSERQVNDTIARLMRPTSVEPKPTAEGKPKHKIGDKVQIRNGLKSILGTKSRGGVLFAGGMEKCCGKVATIKSTGFDGAEPYYLVEENSWAWVEGWLESYTEPKPEPAKALEAVKLYCVKSYEPGHWCTKGKIYEIDADGGITHDDGWVEIAFLPFMRRGGCICGDGTEWEKYLIPLVSRPAKAGEWVLITNAHDSFGDYHNGSVLPAKCVWEQGAITDYGVAFGMLIDPNEYLTLDGYDGRYEQQEPKYWSGKVVCVWAEPDGMWFTVGKVYEYQDGIVNDNYDRAYNTGNPAKSKDESLTRSCVHFIEYKGEAT